MHRTNRAPGNRRWPSPPAFCSAEPRRHRTPPRSRSAPASPSRPPTGLKSVALTGRLHWDLGLYSGVADQYSGDYTPADDTLVNNAGDVGLGTGANLRRGRLGVQGKSGDMSFNLSVDVGGSADDSNEAVIGEAAIYYSPSKSLKLGFGKMKIPVSFEESISSNDISFIERSLPVDMLTDKTLGPKAVNGQLWYYGSRFLLEAAYHFMSDTSTAGENTDEDTGFTIRLAAAPMKTDNAVVHIGGWYDRSEGPVGEAAGATGRSSTSPTRSFSTGAPWARSTR